MGVCHYLFWIKDRKITSVLKKGDKFEIIKFGGNTSVEYNEEFWDMWQEYAGFIKNDVTDFCFVYDDEKPQVSEHLKDRECSDEECIWNKYFIQDAINLLGIKYPAAVFDENGVCVAKAGNFINKKEDDVIKLKASYRKSEQAVLKDVSEKIEMTPFIEEMLQKLEEYDKEY